MDDRVTLLFAGSQSSLLIFIESELATKRCRDCLRINRQRSVNEDHTKYLRRLTAQLKSQRLKSNFTWEIKPRMSSIFGIPRRQVRNLAALI